MTSVLLTGATGFIGSFVLRDLLRETNASVHCLVRCGSPEDGLARVKRSLTNYGQWDDSMTARITVVPGDLSRPLFGLMPSDFSDLAEQIETIYHCGALVNFMQPYPVLKATNVGGVQEVLRLASRGKPLHHCSTLRVHGAVRDRRQVIAEDDISTDQSGLHTGYAQSKWVGERLVATARERGIAISLYRPGMVAGDSRLGASNLTDLMCRMVKGCIQLGCTFDNDMLLDITPVDYVSRAMVTIAGQGARLGGNFHLVTPTPVSWLQVVEWIRAYGYPIEIMPYARWREVLLEKSRSAADNSLAPLTSFFRAEMGDEVVPIYDCRNTLGALEGTDVRCPPCDRGLMNRYLNYFVQVGFLQPSSQH